MSVNYVIWNVPPQIVDLGKFEIRYYSLLFALGFVFGYIILLKIFKKQGLTVELLDKLTIYMVVSTIIGARLGHCLFYEFDYYIQHPLEIILPWRGQIGKDFEFTGFQGLASHGAAIGILIGLYLFARKTKTSYLWVLDMIVIVTALAGTCIRLGNLMNSEIYGKPTGSRHGFVFVNDFSHMLKTRYESIENVKFTETDAEPFDDGTGVPLEVNIEFNRKLKDEARIRAFSSLQLAGDLTRYNYDRNVFLPLGDSIEYDIERKDKKLFLNATIGATPRYPTQIYEAVSYLFIFLILLFIFYSLGPRLKNGFIFGVFLILLFTARFLIEFIKENQEPFEDALRLNMGQILSIPFVIAGIGLTLWKRPAKLVK
jgi:phosphatidylglycerol:prolipoprotein diacylglycerol transferase